MRLDKIAVVGLGYVGLPLAVALARQFAVVGLDINAARITELLRHEDRTREVEKAELAVSTMALTSSPEDCRGADVYVITVPTPVDASNQPDLQAVQKATDMVGRLMDPARQTIVVYESTVYPGVTEELCGPWLEQASGLKCGRDFFLGYSPERINPGDREHRVDNIVKVIAGQTPAVTEQLARLYEAVTTAGVFRARSIKAAEAAKVIENAQRDINIAFMNEITQIFARLDLSIWDVLEAAGTKWNFLPFKPGLVGGHCIGVDPYYLSFRAQQLGHDPDVILAGRATNDGMGGWVADRLHERRGGRVGAVLVLGLTFKENVPDLRNSRVVDVIARLVELGHEITIHDPRADHNEAQHEYGLSISNDALDHDYDLILLAVAHEEYAVLPASTIRGLVRSGGTVADLRGLWRRLDLGPDIDRWSL
jgi:UDP-N-acetyl-D-glucosamine/UDP-N-acetyl-D-galactosamine dehydrogenase